MVKMVNFMSCLFYHNQKTKLKRKNPTPPLPESGTWSSLGLVEPGRGILSPYPRYFEASGSQATL